jgi:predicted DsbA family dithiol-disulfide isomerase
MHSQVSQTANEAGLKFNFDRAVMANSFNAHRLIQLAKSKGLADQVEEELFKAHFSEGKNIDDSETLVQTGALAGLDPEKVREMLSSSEFEKEVRQDEFQAQAIGIRGVPFFVFNNQYAVSGAQAPEIFLRTLEKSFSAFEREAKDLIISEGDSCTEDGDCV